MKTNKILLLSLLLIVSACSTEEKFLTSAPPVSPFFTEQTKIAYIGAPPMMFPVAKTIDEIEVSSQYFKIVVAPVLDKSGKAEALKNLIDEKFATGLDATKRFTVMDKGPILNIMGQQYSTESFVNKSEETIKQEKESKVSKTQTSPGNLKNSTGDMQSTNVDSSNSEQVRNISPGASSYYGYYETHPKEYDVLIDKLSQYTDGILVITITGLDEKNKRLDIDFRIISSFSHNYPLYTGHGRIGYNLEIGTMTKIVDRNDIETVVAEIKKNFPNPDRKDWKIVSVEDKDNGRKITVNAGKNDNIKPGMVGYVIKESGIKTSYKAMFQVTEVFASAFTAELKIEPKEKLEGKVSEQEYRQYNSILQTIKEEAQVVMK